MYSGQCMKLPGVGLSGQCHTLQMSLQGALVRWLRCGYNKCRNSAGESTATLQSYTATELHTWNNGKEVPRWGVADIQKMSPSTTVVVTNSLLLVS